MAGADPTGRILLRSLFRDKINPEAHQHLSWVEQQDLPAGAAALSTTIAAHAYMSERSIEKSAFALGGRERRAGVFFPRSDGGIWSIQRGLQQLALRKSERARDFRRKVLFAALCRFGLVL